MFIHNRGNASGPQSSWDSASTRGASFSSFSVSASVFSSASLGGLNRTLAREPENASLQTLSSLFSAMSLLKSFQKLGGQCGAPRPTPPQGGACGCSPPPPQRPAPQQGKMWDVFFDTKSGTQATPQSPPPAPAPPAPPVIGSGFVSLSSSGGGQKGAEGKASPLVLDLNGNGRPDITGGNITGNGKLEGTPVKGFDLNLQDRQWTSKSVELRPGNTAPDLGAVSAQVFDKAGKSVKQLSSAQVDELKKNTAAWNAAGGDMGLGLGQDQRAEFRDANGKLVGELKRDGDASNPLTYFWGNANENEWTKPWDPAQGGDGMLVWDTDGDGKITSGKELFGHVDLEGKNTFQNGYEKLAHYFDRNGDGVVKGAELKGLKIWEDRNGDGITQDGELVELAKHGISQLRTGFDASDMSSSYDKAPRSPGSLPSIETSFGEQGASSQDELRQSWQVFQTVEVMRLMQLYGLGQG